MNFKKYEKHYIAILKHLGVVALAAMAVLILSRLVGKFIGLTVVLDKDTILLVGIAAIIASIFSKWIHNVSD